MTEGAEIVPNHTQFEVVRETARQEARVALVALLDQDLATLRLGEELGIPAREVVRRSARVTLTEAKEEERPLVMVVAESEGHLHSVVDTLRAPVSIRYKTVTHTPNEARPELPAPEETASSPENTGAEATASSESQSSTAEGTAT